MDVSNLNKLKLILDNNRPLSEAHLQNIMKAFEIEIIYNSNAIEGNTLTLQETSLVVEQGLTVSGKPIKDHLEALNLAEGIEYIKDLVKNNIDISERVLKDIHYLVLKGTDRGIGEAGAYRKVNVAISGSAHIPVESYLVSKAMEDMFIWYEMNKNLLHPVELAAMFHFKLVYIHPFIDGNGRTARLCMNLLLMRGGYPPAVVKADMEKRLAYYKSLETASVEGVFDDFISYIADCVKETTTRYLHFMGIDTNKMDLF